MFAYFRKNETTYMSKMFTLVTMGQGNPIALKRTIDSLHGVIDEVVFGSLCIFPEDKEKIKSYGEEVALSFVELPFNYIFKNGFATTLNYLSSFASNDMVIYLNVGEILISDKNELKNRLSPSYNTYYIDHPTEKHHWYRVYNRKELRWGGIIHEELTGNYRGCSVPLFTFDDTPKDQEGQPYWNVMNDLKECVYFNQYIKLAEQPHLLANTNEGWVKFAKDGYHGFIERLHQKGDMYDAMITGDYDLLMKSINEKK
jgi:hypothetical protein